MEDGNNSEEISELCAYDVRVKVYKLLVVLMCCTAIGMCSLELSVNSIFLLNLADAKRKEKKRVRHVDADPIKLGILKLGSPLALEHSVLDIAQAYIDWSHCYSQRVLLNLGGRRFVEDLLKNSGTLQHRLLDTAVSNAAYLRYLIGMDTLEFGSLMEYCIDELKRTFPRTGVAVGDKHPGGGHKSRLSIRMKVFLTLLRLRKGYTYFEMAALFGWSAQTIWEACRKGESALRRALADFYRWPSEEQQLIACEAFRQKLGFSLNPEDMPVTAFAAVDGTYYCIPNISRYRST